MKHLTALVAELRQSPVWGVRPETLSVMAGLLRATEPQVQAALGAAEPPESEAQTTGTIAVIPLRGLITPRPSLMSLLFGGGGGLQVFRSDLRAAVADDDIDSILIDIDSPGGSTALVAETAAEIRQARRSKPITAIANTIAASAAYWLGSQANEFVVTPSGEVGSIGVFALHEDWSGFDAKAGISTTIVSAGKYKAETHPAKPLSDDAKAHLQESVDDYFGLFLADVAKGRSATAAKVRDGFGEGRMVTAKRAVELGMADRVATYEQTLTALASAPSEGRRAELERAPLAQETQHEDNPPPNEQSEEETARIGRLVLARPIRLPGENQ